LETGNIEYNGRRDAEKREGPVDGIVDFVVAQVDN
jgi:hypothetical protein